MKTKRELLSTICENPGYAPVDSSSEWTTLNQLCAEGWVVWREQPGGEKSLEATAKALSGYPDFEATDMVGPRVKEVTTAKGLPSLLIRNRQHVNMEIDLGVVKGHLTLGNETNYESLIEVQVTLSFTVLDPTQGGKQVSP
jgi:hypothetical protein